MKDHKMMWSGGGLVCSLLMAIYWTEITAINRNNQKHLSTKISAESLIRVRTTKTVGEINQKSSAIPQRLAQATSLPESECEAEIVKVLGIAVNVDPQFVATNLMDLNISYSSKCAIAKKLLRSWPDYNRSLAWAEANFNGRDRGLYLGLALGAHAIISPAEALVDWESAGGSERVRRDAFSGLVNGWFVGDRNSFLEYAQKANPKQAGEIMDQISLSWVTSDLQGAINYLENSSGDGILKTLARMTVALRMNDNPPSEVFAWAESLKGPVRADARMAAIETWAAKSPRDVVAFLETVEPNVKGEFGPALVGKWAASDPLATTQWIDQLPDSPSKGRIVSEAMEVLMTANTIHASEWLKSLPEGDTRDTGILVLLNREAIKDPSGVFPWVDALSNSTLRDKETKRLMNILQRQLEIEITSGDRPK